GRRGRWTPGSSGASGGRDLADLYAVLTRAEDGDRPGVLDGGLDVGQVLGVTPHGRRGDDVVDVPPAAGHGPGDRRVQVRLVEPDDAEPGFVPGVHQVQPHRVVHQDPGAGRVGHLLGHPPRGRLVGGVGVYGDRDAG